MVSVERIKTNHMLLDDLGLWDEFRINKTRDSSVVQRYYNLLKELIDNQLSSTKSWLNTTEARNYFFNGAKYQREVFSALEEDLDELLEKNYFSIDSLLEDIYQRGKQKGYLDIKSKQRFTQADKLALQFAKDYNHGLVRNLSRDLRHTVKNEIFKGVIAGENPHEIAKRLLKVGVQPLKNTTFTPLQRATLIAKTEVSRVQNTGILQSYANEGYTEVKILTAEDNNVCTTCLKYAYEFNKNENVIFDNHGEEKTHKIEDILGLIPFHPKCRCTVTAVWETKGEPPENPIVTNLTEDNNFNRYIIDNGKLYPIVGNTHKGRLDFEMDCGVFADNLTEEELEFIRLYTKKGDSILNFYLRGLQSPDRNPKQEWKNLVKERGVDISFERALELFRMVFNKGIVLNEPLVLIRRENNRYMKVEGNKKVYSDKGILSTSIGENVKSDVYGDELNYILVPAGTKVLYVEGITATQGDFEVMLPPGSNLEYIKDIGAHAKVWKLQ